MQEINGPRPDLVSPAPPSASERFEPSVINPELVAASPAVREALTAIVMDAFNEQNEWDPVEALEARPRSLAR